METAEWYQLLQKPAWAPPAAVFGPVWSVLYVVIAVSFGVVFWQVLQKKLPRAVAIPFVLNLLANAAFSPLQFWLRSNVLATLDILVVLGTTIWCMKTIYPHRKWIAYAQVPYLLWVSFATALQLSITYLNL